MRAMLREDEVIKPKKSPTLAGGRCRTRREVRCVQLGEVGNVNKMACVRVWPKN